MGTIYIYRLPYLIILFIFILLMSFSLDNINLSYILIWIILIITFIAILDFVLNRFIAKKRLTNLFHIKIRHIYNFNFVFVAIIFVSNIYSSFNTIGLYRIMSTLNDISSDLTSTSLINNNILKENLFIMLSLLILLIFFIDFILYFLPLAKCYNEGILLRNNTLLTFENIEKISYTEGAVIKSNYIITIVYTNKSMRSKEYKLISSKKSIDSFIDYINLKTNINIEFIK